MTIVVQKYGGSSVATVEHLKRVADNVVALKRSGHDVVVVVSAMGDATDELLERARAVSPEAQGRELDMLLSVGERISMSLLALAVRELGEEAVSLTGSQCGIITTASHNDARIMEVRPFRVQDELQRGRIVIVAGFQGVSYQRDVTTLGRGGSDTTAVALAAALDAEACEIYSDVAGIYSADPRVVPDAKPLAEIGHEEMQALARGGARVLNADAVAFARTRNIALYARQTGSDAAGTIIRKDAPQSPTGVRGVAHRKEIIMVESSSALAEVWSVIEARGLRPLESASLGVAATWTFAAEDVNAQKRFGSVLNKLGAHLHTGRGTVTLVGEDLHAHPKNLADFVSLGAEHGELFATLSGANSATVVLPSTHVVALAQAAHTRFCGD